MSVLRLSGPTGIRAHDGWVHAYFNGVAVAGMTREQFYTHSSFGEAAGALLTSAAQHCCGLALDGRQAQTQWGWPYEVHPGWGTHIAQAIGQRQHLDFETMRPRFDPVYDKKLRRVTADTLPSVARLISMVEFAY